MHVTNLMFITMPMHDVLTSHFLLLLCIYRVITKGQKILAKNDLIRGKHGILIIGFGRDEEQ